MVQTPRVKKVKTAPPNIIVTEGVENFPENYLIIDAILKEGYPSKDLLTPNLDKFHMKNGCLLVRKRHERTATDQRNLDIWCCLTCGQHKECLRSGWEIGWYNGTESKKI